MERYGNPQSVDLTGGSLFPRTTRIPLVATLRFRGARPSWPTCGMKLRNCIPGWIWRAYSPSRLQTSGRSIGGSGAKIGDAYCAWPSRRPMSGRRSTRSTGSSRTSRRLSPNEMRKRDLGLTRLWLLKWRKGVETRKGRTH